MGAKSLAATRDGATRGARQKKIQRLRVFLEGLPDTLPFVGPDLVMGCASGYQVDSIRPFIESLFDLGQFRGEADRGGHEDPGIRHANSGGDRVRERETNRRILLDDQRRASIRFESIRHVVGRTATDRAVHTESRRGPDWPSNSSGAARFPPSSTRSTTYS